jgi:hypothetical protein
MKNSLDNYFNFPAALLDLYHHYDIDEIDVVILLLVAKQVAGVESNFDMDFLIKRMHADKDTIDKHFAALLSKKYIRLLTKDGKIKVSIAPLIKKMIGGSNSSVEEDGNIYNFLEREKSLPLTALEISMIDDWVRHNVSFEDVVECWRKAIEQNVKTINYLDGIIRKEFFSD